MRRKHFLTGVMVALVITAAVVSPAHVESTTRNSTSLTVPAPKTGRVRPLAAVVADNAGSEATDFVIPYGVLKDSGVADVVSLSTRPGPVQLWPALRIRTDLTLAKFDAATPRGADVVIVPAMAHDRENPVVARWVRSQYAKGATIVSICTGAFVVARAGLLDGRRATSHWALLDDLKKEFPEVRWIRDRRYVQDGRLISTSGVSASIPASLALVEAIAGHNVALRTARRLGVAEWSASHRTADFSRPISRLAIIAINYLSFWRHDTIVMPVANGFDEIALALTSDAWGETFLARVVTRSATKQPITSRNGLVLLPDVYQGSGDLVLPSYSGPSLKALDAAFSGIERRYGRTTAGLVALLMESSRR